MKTPLITAFASLALLAGHVSAAFIININYQNIDETDSRYAEIERAKNDWQSLITGFVDNEERTLEINLNITTSGHPGVTSYSTREWVGGYVRFNSTNIDIHENSNPYNVALHEIGHALGFHPQIWGENNIPRTDYEYKGENALEAYRQEFGLHDADFIPLETLHHSGGDFFSERFHWYRPANHMAPSNAPIVISGINKGKSWDEETMTSPAGSRPLWISDTTLGVLRDLGYTTVDYRSAPLIPEPTALLLLTTSSLFLLRRKRN